MKYAFRCTADDLSLIELEFGQGFNVEGGHLSALHVSRTQKAERVPRKVGSLGCSGLIQGNSAAKLRHLKSTPRVFFKNRGLFD